jgi:phosphoribosylformylglycinamidine cyclo-ligase
MKEKKLDYASAGVDIAAADKAKEKIKTLAKATFNSSVLSEIGDFGGFFKPNLRNFKDPVFISSCDGVGTKLKVAFMANRHDTVGEDLVNHCINDILVHGAKPLFFLDYIATGKLNPETVAEIVGGLSRGCQNAGMALIGGETAEMPDMYAAGEYDLAGFIVGMVEQDKIVNGTSIETGDVLIGLGSNGLHTNGYSLARKVIFEIGGYRHDSILELPRMTIASALLMVHRCYLAPISKLLGKFNIKGMAHITGGGIAGNLIRVLPENSQAIIQKGRWSIPPIFEFIQKTGNIADENMYQAFNMGVGYILVVSESEVGEIINTLKSMEETPYIIGRIENGNREVIIKD